MKFLAVILAIVRKDVRGETRTKEILSSMSVFSILVLLVFNFTVHVGREGWLNLGPGILWSAFVFAGTLGLNRSFAIERENQCLLGLMLAPVDRTAIYFGKLISNVLFMIAAEVLVIPLFLVFFNIGIFSELSVGELIRFIFIVLIGTIGYAAVGTIIAAVAANTNMREVLLPVLLLPLTIPLVIAAAEATRIVFLNDPAESPWAWIQILLVFATVFTTISWMTFNYVVEE